MSKIPTYGWKAKLLSQHTFATLEQLLEVVKSEHQNPRENGRCIENGNATIFIYDAKGRKKMDEITWAVYHKQQRGDVE
ncbi:hypothetical protein fHeYen801_107 [Yersinia phage fHe-Yen8-01]|nr:hypothetical protein fHeYen801_107 [Yersinia phage fHe-Yen8-01]